MENRRRVEITKNIVRPILEIQQLVLERERETENRGEKIIKEIIQR